MSASEISAAIDTALGYLTDGGKLNEANTKALVIEPMLRALGWKTDSLSSVEREYQVYDGTFLDFALKAPHLALFVEAKSFGRTLDDEKFVAQTINYANNQGVLWCVLTNGLLYRVYKTNEPVRMDKKLLFEVNLEEAKESENRQRVSTALERLTNGSIASGDLDEWGKAVFVDNKVTAAITKIYSKPPKALVRAIIEATGDKNLTEKDIAASLSRIAATGVSLPPKVGLRQRSKETKAVAGDSKWTLDHHLRGKPQEIISIFEQINPAIMKLGDDIRRTIAKQYVAYSRRQSFASLKLYRSKIDVSIKMPFDKVPNKADPRVRDMTNVGHHGLGNTRVTVSSQSDVNFALQFVVLGYQRSVSSSTVKVLK